VQINTESCCRLRLLCRVLFFLLCLTSCASRERAPVEEISVVSAKHEVDGIGGQIIRIVQAGDTLYSIAFENGLDVNLISQWNDIADPRKISIGQRVRLTAPIGFKEEEQALEVDKNESIIQKERVVRVPQSNEPSNAQTSKTKQKESKFVSKPVLEAAQKRDSENQTWFWPIEGKVIEPYSIKNGQQGIAIEGSLKEPVVATKSGEVVYVGDSLKGYGNLIIIKHDEPFLSAYAHNFTTFVKEGQFVKAKQKIALVGLDNKQQSALHFQIRVKGKPKDPAKFLSVK